MATQDEAAMGTTVDVPPLAELERKVACPMCREPIEKGARVCIHCKSDLSWRRFLPVGSTTLAMLTALVAVVASVGPQVKNLFEASGDLFTAKYAGHRETAIIVLANNHTSKKVLLVHASIEKRFIVEPTNPGPGNTAFENFFVGFSAKAGSIVNAHDSGEVVLEVDRGTTRSSIQAMRREEGGATCFLRARVGMDVNEYVESSVDCRDVESLASEILSSMREEQQYFGQLTPPATVPRPKLRP